LQRHVAPHPVFYRHPFEHRAALIRFVPDRLKFRLEMVRRTAKKYVGICSAGSLCVMDQRFVVKGSEQWKELDFRGT
jgi:hypothetical protein